MSLFFMLSGFVLALRYSNGASSYKSYLINRFARIYPIYVVAAVATLPWLGITFGSGSIVDVAKGLGQCTLLVLANILLIQAWFPQYFGYWNDGGSWSISVEAFCYLLLPLILPNLMRISMRKLVAIAAVCFLLSVLPGLSAALFSGPSNNVFYSMPIFRLPEFIMGICVNLAIRQKTWNWDGKALSIFQFLVLIIFIVYLGFVGPVLPLYVGHNWIVLPVIAFIIFSLSSDNGPIASILSSAVFVWLGKISYCFYSFQALLILFLISHHDEFVHVMPYLANNKVLAAGSLVSLVAVSALGYYLIEVPARGAIKAYFLRNTTITLLAYQEPSMRGAIK